MFKYKDRVLAYNNISHILNLLHSTKSWTFTNFPVSWRQARSYCSAIVHCKN